MTKAFEVLDVVPKDVHLILEIPLAVMVKLNKASNLLITKEEKTDEDTEIIDCLESFLKNVKEIVKELDQNDQPESIIKRIKL